MIRPFRRTSQSGFTIVEALIAFMLLTIGIIPLFSLTATISSAEANIRHNTIAANLAQEGVEVIRFIRDWNWSHDFPFNAGLLEGTYRVEWSSNILPYTDEESSTLLIDEDDGGTYNYSAGVLTPYRRKVTIEMINAWEMKVTSVVSWTERGNNVRSITVESHLYDWK